MDVLILQKPSAAALALSPQCPELSHRDPLATAYGPTSPAAKPWAAVPLVVPVTANTSPGRQHSPPLRPPPRQYLAPTPGLGHSTGAGQNPAGQLSTCLRDPYAGQGGVTSVRKGNWKARRTGLAAGANSHPPQDRALHRSSLWWVPACLSLSPFLSAVHMHRKAQSPLTLSSSPSPHYLSPRQARDSPNSLSGGHVTQSAQGRGLAQSAFSSTVV